MKNITNNNDNTKERKNKLLIPKIDVVFQSLFGKNNPQLTKAFIQAILEEDIKSIKINDNKELYRERPNDKLGILDLQLDINNNKKVDVEVQLLNGDNFIERILFYVTRMYSSQIKIGEDYNEAKRVVLIAIIDFELEELKEMQGMESKWKLIETKNRKNILTDLIEINIISLKKAKKEYTLNNNNEKAQWMLFLDNPESKEMQEIVKKNKDINDATIIVKEMSEDEKMQRLADLRLKAIMDEKAIRRYGYKKGIEAGIKKGKEEGIEKGIEQGIKSGEKNKAIEIAKKLIIKGMSPEEIMELTGLSKQEINSIS